VLACIRTKSPGQNESKLWTPNTGKPTQTWCPIKEGIPGEKVINVFDVIDFPLDDEEDYDEEEYD
jgi:hypothetical protein